jgi:hypothetical protein
MHCKNAPLIGAMAAISAAVNVHVKPPTVGLPAWRQATISNMQQTGLHV